MALWSSGLIHLLWSQATQFQIQLREYDFFEETLLIRHKHKIDGIFNVKWVSQVKILAFYNATSPSEQQQKSPKKSKLLNLWLKFQSSLLGPPVECVDQSGWGLDQRVPAVLVVSLISNLTSFSRIGVQSNMTSLRSSYIDRVRLKYPSRKLQVTHTLHFSYKTTPQIGSSYWRS